MTIKKIIEALQTRGYTIKAYKRKDGGYLIQSINGELFAGAKGNIKAREILNIDLSTKKTAQLRKITRPRLTPIPKEVKNQMDRINRRLRRQGKKWGKISTRQYRENVARYGEAEARRKLTELERYNKGLANFSNIAWLLQRIRADASLWPCHYWDSIYTLVQAKATTLQDKVMMQIYNILYDVENTLRYTLPSNQQPIIQEVGAAYQRIKNLF